MSPLVLVIEDDSELRGLLMRGLREEGLDAEGSGTGKDAFERALARPPDAVVLDIGLPDADGRDLCQALRAAGLEAPILFLTARDTLADKLAGFTAGGDDYLTKPFQFAELLARLRAILARTAPDQRINVNNGGLRLDPVNHSVSSGSGSLPLTPTEFRVLAALAARSGETMRRREIVAAAWPAGAIVHDNTLDVYVRRLRRKLDDLPGAQRIVTTHGVGYALR
jgi:two-component system response regulator MprA